MRLEISEEEIDRIRAEIRKEFPDDPALQEVHIARKIIAAEARHAGMSFLQYIGAFQEHREKGGDLAQSAE
jgi:hypothetical protein